MFWDSALEGQGLGHHAAAGRRAEGVSGRLVVEPPAVSVEGCS